MVKERVESPAWLSKEIEQPDDTENLWPHYLPRGDEPSSYMYPVYSNVWSPRMWG